jgi:ATP-binding cassette subfamily C exporter for protease/lipase
MMIVAWVLGPRVLAPLVQVVMLWKSVVTARDAYQRLDKLLQALARAPERHAPASRRRASSRWRV